MALGPAWTAAGFDPGASAALGLPTRWPDRLLLVLGGGGGRGLAACGGSAAGGRAVRDPRRDRAAVRGAACRGLLAGSVAVAAALGAVGLYASFWLDLPPGPAVAVLGAAAYGACAGGHGARGRGRPCARGKPRERGTRRGRTRRRAGLRRRTWCCESLDFAVPGGTSVGVLGPNGGGKTTLFARAGRRAGARARASCRCSGRPAYVAQTDRTRLDFPVSALDVALMGSLARGRWWLPAARAGPPRRRACARARGPGSRARHPLRRAVGRPAPAGADRPGAGPGRAGAAARRAAGRRRPGQRRADGAASSSTCATRGAPLLVSTHDVQSARAFDLVLCLNRRQVAFGPPGRGPRPRGRSRPPTGARSWCSTTATGRCARSPSSTTSTDHGRGRPSPRPAALRHRPARPGGGGAAGRDLRRPELLGGGLPPGLPGRVAGARPASGAGAGLAGGRPAGARRARRRGRGRRAGGAGRPRRAHRGRHRHRRGGHRHVRPGRAAGAGAGYPGAPGRAAVRRPAGRDRRRPGRRGRARGAGRAGARRPSPSTGGHRVRRRGRAGAGHRAGARAAGAAAAARRWRSRWP